MYKIITPFFFILAISVSRCFAQCDISESPTQWQTDGVVYSTARIGNKLFIGGSFNTVSNVTGNTLVFPNFNTGNAPVLNFPEVNGTINTIISDGQNGWFIGGSFSKIGNYTCTNLAHVKSNYTVDHTWFPNVNSAINTLVMDNGKLFAGGNFSTINSLTRLRFACFDLSTLTLTPLSFLLNGNVNHLVVSNNILYIAGAFTHIAGVDIRYSIMRMNLADESLLAPYQYINGAVNKLVVTANTVYVQGTFTQVFYQARNMLAAFDLSGNIKPWNPNPNGAVNSMVANGTCVYLGGTFTNTSGVSRNRLAAYDALTGAIKTWSPNVNDEVYQLFLENSRLYACGKFKQVNGAVRNSLAAFDTLAHALDSFNIGATNGDVLFASGQNSTLLVTGNFSGYNVKNRTNLAALDLGNYSVLPWQPDPSNPTSTNTISTLSIAGTTLFAGGSFTSIAGQSRTHVAAFDSSGNLLSFNAAITGNRVNAIATGNNSIFIGGEFTAAAGSAHANICAFDAVSLTPVLPALTTNGIVRTLSYQNGLLYLGGQFSAVNGQTRNYAASVETTSGALTAWDPNPNQTVLNIHPYNSSVYLGGIFTQVNGVNRKYLAAVDSLTGALKTWNPNPDGQVQAISTFKEKLFIGGAFTNITGTSRAYMATFDEGSKTLLSLQVTPDSWITNVTAFDSTLFVCGSYLRIDNKPRRGLSIYNLFELRPSLAPSAAQANQLTTTSLRLSWKPGNGNNYLVLARANGPVNANPLNNVLYTANGSFGLGSPLNTDNYVVYKGPDTTAIITNLQATGTYAFAVFTYNAYGSCIIHNYTAAIKNNVQLPVTWLHFSAVRNPGATELSWSTSSETDNSGFEVERGWNSSTNWESIGFVRGAGTSRLINRYLFTDRDALPTGTIYYRLKQVDFNGNATIGKTVAVVLQPASGSEFTISPSPAKNSLRIQSEMPFVSCRILTVSGIEMKRFTGSDPTLNIAGLPSGLYFMVLEDEAGKTHSRKFVKE